jgi:spermidine/putrescine transport system ATP-binding protein
MQVELKRLQKKLGITFVYVTHDQEEALTMSDRIAVMNEGVIEQLGTPREIYDRPLTKFVAGFIGESNIFDGKVISVNDGIIYVETSAGTMKVKGNGFEAGEDIHVSIRPEHIKVSADSVEGFNLRGKIKDNIYMGTFVKTSVDLKDKTEIKYSRIEKEEEFTEGNFVNIYWNPERAVAIKSKS